MSPRGAGMEPVSGFLRGVAKKRTFFFQRDFTCGPKPFFFWGVQMEFSIQNEINSFHLFCNTIRLL